MRALRYNEIVSQMEQISGLTQHLVRRGPTSFDVEDQHEYRFLVEVEHACASGGSLFQFLVPRRNLFFPSLAPLWTGSDVSHNLSELEGDISASPSSPDYELIL